MTAEQGLSPPTAATFCLSHGWENEGAANPGLQMTCPADYAYELTAEAMRAPRSALMRCT